MRSEDGRTPPLKAKKQKLPLKPTYKGANPRKVADAVLRH